MTNGYIEHPLNVCMAYMNLKKESDVSVIRFSQASEKHPPDVVIC